jgi:hypothetical protein
VFEVQVQHILKVCKKRQKGLLNQFENSCRSFVKGTVNIRINYLNSQWMLISMTSLTRSGPGPYIHTPIAICCFYCIILFYSKFIGNCV